MKSLLLCLADQAISADEEGDALFLSLLQGYRDIIPVFNLKPVPPQSQELGDTHKLEALSGKTKIPTRIFVF